MYILTWPYPVKLKPKSFSHLKSQSNINSKKPLIILGESFFKAESANYLFYAIKDFLIKKNKLNDDWNSLNILSVDAATVGSYDLDIFNKEKDLIQDLKENKFEMIYLLGQDDLDFTKKNEFIIYQGTHGDKGAEIADIILPGAAYTEQNGYFTNLEGKVQKAYKASYPPGNSKEDWQIINDLAKMLNNRNLFNDKEELESSMFNYLKLKEEKKNSINSKINEQKRFINEKINISLKNYYFSNVISRASKTMIDCHNSKLDIKKTGTEG